ncbi:MAG TPA: hypothetical protein VLA12_02410 [Planctomycetaceae bacterium]|nr:hypothetical protein [Planctomycetaceae bacterium]
MNLKPSTLNLLLCHWDFGIRHSSTIGGFVAQRRGWINADTYAQNARELRDEEAGLRLEIDRCSRGRNEIIDIAVKAFELSQSLREKWLTADYAAKCRILEIVCLNCSLDGVSLVATMRKPFDLLAKGLLQKVSRDDRI